MVTAKLKDSVDQEKDNLAYKSDLENMIFRVSFFATKISTELMEKEVNWKHLCGSIRNPTIATKNKVIAICPAVFKNENRQKENVIESSMLAFEFSNTSFAAVRASFLEMGYCFAQHTIYSHKRITKKNPNAEERIIVYVPVSKPIPKDRYNSLWDLINGQTGGRADKAAGDPSQVFYAPSKYDENSEYEFYIFDDGGLLDWEASLAPTTPNTNNDSSEEKENKKKKAEILLREASYTSEVGSVEPTSHAEEANEIERRDSETKVTLVEKVEEVENLFEPVTLSADMARENTFLIDKLIPNGELTILAGSGGESKSYASLAIAAAISRGHGFPYTKDGESKEPKNVLVYTAEDSIAKIVIPRLIGLGAKLDNIQAVGKAFNIVSKAGLKDFERHIKNAKPGLVIIDPATAYCGSLDLERRPQALSFMYPLDEIAGRYDIPFLIVFHFNKGTVAESDGIKMRISGSAAIVDAARSALVVGRNPDNPIQKAIVQVKVNYSKEGKSLLYEIGDDQKENSVGKFDWKGFSNITADDLSIVRDKRLESRIIELLRENGEMMHSILFEACRSELGVTDKQFRTAREKIGITRENGCIFNKQGCGTVPFYKLPLHLAKKI